MEWDIMQYERVGQREQEPETNPPKLHMVQEYAEG